MADPHEARAALGRGDWPRVRELTEEPGGASAEALEVRAEAAYALGDLEAAVSQWEESFALRATAGDDVAAARAAAMIALHLLIDTGLMAPVRGWLRRADRLLVGHDDAPPQALVAMVRTYERFFCGDPAESRREAARAVELGLRLGVRAAVVIGRTVEARLSILEGDVAGGLAGLDEVSTELMSGEVDPLTTGIMYCELICAAQGLALHDRAREWTEMMDRWRQGVAVGGVNGRCRVHRAELLRLSGPGELAEEEALAACEDLRPWLRREFGWPLVELGNIRLRRGDLSGAEEAFLAAHEHAWCPQPGLALLRLEQGDLLAASALVADAIAHPLEIPSKERPPFGDLRLAPLLDAQAEIAAAAGDLATARRAAAGLELIAATYASPALRAGADLASGRCALMADRLDEAITACTRAVGTWAELGAPYESAAARLVLGEAHARAGNPSGARLEWTAAHLAFRAFGAIGRAEGVERLLDTTAETPTRPGARTAASASLRRQADSLVVGFEGRDVLMPDLKGLRYLQRLLADPGREFHALDLVTVEQGGSSTASTGQEPDLTVGRSGDAGLPLLDEQARAAYRRRLVEVEDDIAEAAAMNDLGRVALAERDRDYLLAELGSAVGLGGRLRVAGGTTERARTSVTRSLRYALRSISQHHPDLGAHLDRTVHTGIYCSYVPDPISPVVWTLSRER